MLSIVPSFARAVTLRLQAEAAGVVRVRGTGVQGVDWHAAGRSAVTVPVVVYDAPTGGLTVQVDGKPVPLNDEIAGPSNSEEIPPGPVFDDDAYQLAGLWQPGRSEAVRRWTLTAVVVFVLVLAVARYADPKRATLWMVLAAVGLSGGAVLLFPTDRPRRVLAAEGRPGWEWVWFAGAGVVEEPWTPGLRFVPRSAGQLAAAEPVLTCDAAGRPVSIRCRIQDDERAVFIRPRVTPSPASGPRP